MLGSRVDFAQVVRVHGFLEGEERGYASLEVVAAMRVVRFDGSTSLVLIRSGGSEPVRVSRCPDYQRILRTLLDLPPRHERHLPIGPVDAPASNPDYLEERDTKG